MPCSSLNKSTYLLSETSRSIAPCANGISRAKKNKYWLFCGEAAQPAGDTVMLSKKAREAVSRGTDSFEAIILMKSAHF